MNIQQLHLDTPGGAGAWLTALHRSRLARVGARLKLTAAMVAAGAQFIPLGDNGKLLAELTARVQAARVCGV